MRKTAILCVVIIATIATSLTVSLQASGQNYNIPGWIKNNAKWWAEGQVGDSDFINALQWLINNRILVIEEQIGVNNESENAPPPVEIGYDCVNNLGKTWENPDDHGYMEYFVTIQNFDGISHSAVVEVVDKTDNGNRLSSKTIEVILQPKEIKKVKETLELTALSGSSCIVNLLNVK